MNIEGKIMIGGSKYLGEYEDFIDETIEMILRDYYRYSILVGDCYGVDNRVGFVSDFRFEDGDIKKTTVYHIKDSRVKWANVHYKKICGNKYTDKDNAMIKDSTEAIFLCVNNSKGTERNIKEYEKTGKPFKVIRFNSYDKEK